MRSSSALSAVGCTRIVPLGGKEPPPLPGWLAPVMFKLIPALRSRIRDSVEAMRAVAGALVRRWSREWRPDLVVRIRTLRERQLPICRMPTSMHTWPMCMRLVPDGHDVHFRLHGAVLVLLGEFAFTCRDLLVGTRAALLIAGRHLHYLD